MAKLEDKTGKKEYVSSRSTPKSKKISLKMLSKDMLNLVSML
jgi:hypothetical protein